MRVHLATSLDDALAFKASEPDASPIAGGTDALVHWPGAHDRHDGTWLDLSHLEELQHVEFGDEVVEFGALVTYWDVMRDSRFDALPLMPKAAATVGAVQIQARGTWAGNVANASPAADGVPALMAYDAEVILASSRGRRAVPLAGFYHGYKQLESRPDELIAAIRVPLREHDHQDFIKVGSRAAQAITKVGLAYAHSAAGWRIVANSMAPTVCRCANLESLVESGVAITGPDDLAATIAADVSPIDDIRSTAEYRQRVFGRVLYHALRPICASFS
jgi:CO/xanthine dehydrogenase FAD-binding subunit